MTEDWERLFDARRRLPVGQRIRGTVTRVPQPGVIGLFVDLGEPPEGFVDVMTLPREPQRWPPPGTVADFEVLQHRHGQVRLFPLDARWRTADPFPGCDSGTWSLKKSRYREGQLVTACTTAVFTSNREYTVAFEGNYATLEWSREPPPVGSTGTYRITAILDTTRQILLTPVDPSAP